MDFLQVLSKRQDLFVFDDLVKIGITCDQLMNKDYSLHFFTNKKNIVENFSELIKKLLIKKNNLKKNFFDPQELIKFIKNKNRKHIYDIDKQLFENYNILNDIIPDNLKIVELYNISTDIVKKLFLTKDDLFLTFWTPNDFEILGIDNAFLNLLLLNKKKELENFEFDELNNILFDKCNEFNLNDNIFIINDTSEITDEDKEDFKKKIIHKENIEYSKKYKKDWKKYFKKIGF